MSFFIAIIGAMLSLDVIWWFVLARLAATPAARAIVHLFMAAQLIALLWLIGGRVSGGGYDRFLPKFVVTNLFIWHFIGLGLLSIIGVAMIPILLVSKMVPRRHVDSHQSTASHSWTRRDFLRFGAAFRGGKSFRLRSGICLRRGALLPRCRCPCFGPVQSHLCQSSALAI